MKKNRIARIPSQINPYKFKVVNPSQRFSAIPSGKDNPEKIKKYFKMVFALGEKGIFLVMVLKTK
jgi:hypothetical protein